MSESELAEFKWTVEDYIQYGRENALDQRWVKELENASAKVHISRLEALKLQTRQSAEKLYGKQALLIDDHLRKTYEGSYYRTAFEVQKGVGIGWDMAGLDERRVHKVLSKPWTTDGQTFSDRIWEQRDRLVDTVHTQLTQNLIRGLPPDKAIRDLAKAFNTSKSNAGRLIMTESAFFASAGQRDAYDELGVEEYQILATLDGVTCALCGSLDGVRLSRGEFEEGTTAPPFHPWCRCTTAPWFEGDEDGERLARNAEGEWETIPAGMSYAEWQDRYVDVSLLTRRVNSDNIFSMRVERFNKIKIGFEKKGGIIASSNEIDKHLIKNNAMAATLNENTILIRSNRIPTAATMFEELIHTTQYATGRATGANWLDMEIEAKEKLIQNKRAYEITDKEHKINLDQLECLLRKKEADNNV